MATIHVLCPHCKHYDGVSKNGKAPTGIQRYLCNDCNHSFQLDYIYNGNKPDTHENIIDLAVNGAGVRDTGRIMKISINTVIAHLKKIKSSESYWKSITL